MSDDVNQEIRFLGDLQRLVVRPGDVFVLKVSGRISEYGRTKVREQWDELMPGVKCLVLDDSINIGVIARVDGDYE